MERLFESPRGRGESEKGVGGDSVTAEAGPLGLIYLLLY